MESATPLKSNEPRRGTLRLPRPLWIAATAVVVAAVSGAARYGFPLYRQHAGTRVTDSGLARLKGLSELRQLWLKNTSITDPGLAHIKGLINLHELSLADTHVTDSGLRHLRRLVKLRQLWLAGTDTTANGVSELERWLQGMEVYR